jgi:hypothetical protein
MFLGKISNAYAIGWKMTAQRVTKGIRLPPALISIEEGKQGLYKNHSIAQLTRVATILLPFSTVAEIMTLPESIAPTKSLFWKTSGSSLFFLSWALPFLHSIMWAQPIAYVRKTRADTVMVPLGRLSESTAFGLAGLVLGWGGREGNDS